MNGNKPCHFFRKGYCREGANCKFSHEQLNVTHFELNDYLLNGNKVGDIFNQFLKSNVDQEPTTASLSTYPIPNGYEKRPIDCLRNATDVVTPILQLIVRRYVLNPNHNFKPHGDKLVDRDWIKFAAGDSFNDLNILLKLIQKNLNSSCTITLNEVSELASCGITPSELVDCFDFLPNNLAQVVVTAAVERKINASVLCNFLIYAARNVIAHQAYKTTTTVTTSKYSIYVIVMLYELVLSFSASFASDNYDMLLVNYQSLVATTKRLFELKRLRRKTKTVSKEQAQAVLSRLQGAVAAGDKKAISFCVLEIGNRLPAYKKN